MLERPKTGERTLLVHLKFRDPRLTADLSEFKELAVSAGAIIVAITISSRSILEPKFLIGKGKIAEIKEILATSEVDLILFNHELTPSQERNLEKEFSCRVLDRAGLILDIFAQRAHTAEGKLQVELAQLQHLKTRLVRGWTHLERQKGGIGLRGPGETQLESDRRLIRGRIKNIVKRLEKVRYQREQSRNARRKVQIPTVALVGYTNSGKSTLFNVITNSSVYAENKLFATLDPTLRSVELPYIGKAILADTVGFIRDLPHDLIDAFKATLEETKDADLLLHVIDCSDELWREKRLQVIGVLHEIGALNIPTLEVYNKIDLLEGVPPSCQYDDQNLVVSLRISATCNQGLDQLLQAIAVRLCTDITAGELILSPEQTKIRALLYELGAVDKERIDQEGNFVLQITIQQQRWNILCAKFKHLDLASRLRTNFKLQGE